MFCVKCGTALQDGSKFCSECGEVVSADAAKNIEQFKMTSGQSSAIWNPSAASNWSLILSPAFGSYLHALNWRALGEPEKEKMSMRWFYFSLVVMAIYLCIKFFMAHRGKADMAASALPVIYLIVWYISAGRAQAKYVKVKFGYTYLRRPWAKPLLIGVAAIFGFFVVGFVVIGLIVDSVSAWRR